MTEKPIAYVMEQTLGSITHYLNLRQHDDAVSARHWLPIRYPETKVSLNWTVTGSLLARQALGAVIDEVGGIFVHTTTLAPLSLDYFRRKPAVLSTDGTPYSKREMREAYGLAPESRAAARAKHFVYRRVFAEAAAFVAWSNWTKQSFVEDYGCAENNVEVIPPGVDLEQFGVGQRDHELPRILFVGGDFVRKGGDLLLDVYRRRLRGRAELHLVTRTPVQEEPGVYLHRDVQINSPALRSLYATCNLFALPTRADCYSLVCMEAMAASLPVVTTRMGGIEDIVRDGQTGHVIAVDDGETLGDTLEALVADSTLRKSMGEVGRADALARLDARKNSKRLFDYVRSRC